MDCCVFKIIFKLAVFLLMLSLAVSGTTNGSEAHCALQLKVPRNTTLKAPVMKPFKINCTVNHRHECHWRPRISWCKIYNDTDNCNALNYSHKITTEWKQRTQNEGMAFLVFHNITVEDAGLYRCKGGDWSVSHTINVIVTVDNQAEDSLNQNKTIVGDHNSASNDHQLIWPYVYICSGIGALVVIIMTVTLLIIRHKGSKSTSRDVTAKNQYKEAPRSDLPPPPLPQPRQSSRSPSNIPPSYRGCETLPVRGACSAGRDSDSSRNTAGIEQRGEENVLVYASLNHQAMPRGPRRAAPQEPELTEYAPIRFR